MAELTLITQPGGRVWVAEAINWTGQGAGEVLPIGINTQAIVARAGRGLRHALGQMYGVVGPGMIFAEYVFRGLRRDMYVREDREAARKKLAVTWNARRDAVLGGDKINPTLVYMEAPADRVFVVYVSPNESSTKYPDIFGWAEHWAWVSRDPDLPGAPIDWSTRYDEKIWSKDQ